MQNVKKKYRRRLAPFWCSLLFGLFGTSDHLAPVAVPPGWTSFYRSIFKRGCGDGNFATTLKRKDKHNLKILTPELMFILPYCGLI